MPPPSHVLTIHTQSADDVAVLTLTGDVDLATGPELRRQILEAARSDTTVIIDLRSVEFMDSPGLGILIHCHRQLTDRHNTMIVQAPRGHVRDLFATVGLASTLHVVEQWPDRR